MENDKKIDICTGSRIKILHDVGGKNGVAYKEGDETHAECYGGFHLCHNDWESDLPAVLDLTNPGHILRRPLLPWDYIIVLKKDPEGRWC